MKKDRISMEASIFWNTAGSLVYMVTQWLISIMVVRIAGVSVAGDLSLAMSVNNIFYSLAMFGIRNYQVTDVKGKYNNATYIINRVITCLGATFLCTIYCAVIGYSSAQRGCILLYCAFKMAEAMYDVYAGICQKAWRMDCIGKSWMLKGVVTFAVFGGVLYITDSLLYAILAMAAVSFLIIIVYDIPITGKLEDIRVIGMENKSFQLMKECFPLVCYQLLTTAIPTIPRIFMERMLGNYDLGIYSSVAAPTVIVQMGASYIFNPFMTMFAELYMDKKKKEFWDTFKKCMLAILGLSVVALVGGKILGRWGLNLLYGSEVAEYVNLLLPIIVCTILTALVWFLGGLLTVVRDFKGLNLSNIPAVLISAIGSLVFMNIIDMQGASLALIIALVVQVICMIGFLRKKVKGWD